MTCYTDRNFKVSHQCEFVCDELNVKKYKKKKICHTGCSCKVSRQCEFVCENSSS